VNRLLNTYVVDVESKFLIIIINYFREVTKVANSSTHWEGGKGCRNKVTMSKNDNKKFSGTNKTISKKK